MAFPGEELHVAAVLWGDPAEEKIGDDQTPWDPTYVLKALPYSHEVEFEIMMLGQVEYLSGKSGALTGAIDDCIKETWGSLRCVLGELHVDTSSRWY